MGSPFSSDTFVFQSTFWPLLAMGWRCREAAIAGLIEVSQSELPLDDNAGVYWDSYTTLVPVYMSDIFGYQDYNLWYFAN